MEQKYYRMNIAGVERDLPICPLNENLMIAGFVIFGDPEITTACSKALLQKAPEYDYLISAEAKGIPLVHEMARLAGNQKYFLARKAPKLYMTGVFEVVVKSITTENVQKLYLDKADADLMKGKRILIVDDVISTGESLRAVEDNSAGSVYAGAAIYSGSYAPCSVARSEVGMFADLKMVVLCNGNTASAAEVFTASLRDHKNVTIIGETTFGKGIMQRYYSLFDLTAGVYDGYVKMTTHAYVTECGVTYHDIGIAPTEGCEVALSEEAMEYHFYLIPEELDNQLQKAIEVVKSK